MKKLLFGLLLLASCTPKKNVLDDAEAYLKSHLKDPASYAPIDKKIIDTTWDMALHKGRISSDSFMLAGALKQSTSDSLIGLLASTTDQDRKDAQDKRQKSAIMWQESLEKNKKELASIKVDSIWRIRTHFNYRAKNGMGALDVFQNDIDYFPKNKEFIMQKAD